MTSARRPAPAGDYDRRISIQLRAAGSNALGEATGAWQEIAKVWAKVTPLRGNEWAGAGAMQDAVTHEIRWRYGVTVSRENRLVELGTGQAYEISSIMDSDSARADIVALCLVGVRDGR